MCTHTHTNNYLRNIFLVIVTLTLFNRNRAANFVQEFHDDLDDIFFTWNLFILVQISECRESERKKEKEKKPIKRAGR